MKKIITISLFSFLFFFVGFTSLSAEETTEYDYRDGLLDHNLTSVTGTIDTNQDYRLAFDNDLETYANMVSLNNIQFEKPVNIKGLFLAMSGYSGATLRLTYIDDTNNKIITSSYVVSEAVGEGKYYNLNFDNVIRIDITNSASGRINEIDFFGEFSEEEIPDDLMPPSEIRNVNYLIEKNSIALNWDNPTDENFSKVMIYLNGELIGTTDRKSFNIQGLEENTDYSIRITTVDQIGNESDGIELNLTTEEDLPPPETPEDLPEIRDLKIEADPERVDLSWKNPPQFFEKAKIYRKATGTTTASVLSKLNPFAPIELQASGDFEPLFETNGTTFADLSVEPEQSYEYKVTNFYNGMESNGVTVQTSIPKPPLVDTGKIELPFGVGALIESGNGLLLFIGGFVLLALAFIFVPKVVALIKQSFTGGASGKSNGGTVATGARLTERQQKLVTIGGRQPREPRQGRG